MAVVIKRAGMLPSKKVWEGTCSSCKTAVEYLTEDADGSGDDQRDGGWTRIICPLEGCQQSIFGSLKPSQLKS